jgi:HSP20 family protein
MHMAWRRYRRSLFDEMEDMRAFMDELFQQVAVDNRLALPPGQADMMLPAVRGEFRLDVLDHADEVTITADIIPGVEKKDIKLDLINPRALEISFERKKERDEKKEGFYVRERSFGSLRRVVPLPAEVTEKDARATFKNGVLEVHLKKSVSEPLKGITIE